ncbi:MAG: CHASE3 domain-containing protein [Hyphomonadaceae bacterium JAD_PAG50586_4]|nr:MAG: CHASE3 domain-containing protein [Hyphomonadaceae bacterium JAD_PAG50586_4]
MTVSVLGRRLPAVATYVAGLGLSLFLLLLTTGIALWQTERGVELNQSVRESLATRSHLRMLLRGLQDAETGQRGYLLTGDESYLEPYLTSREDVPTRIDALEGWLAPMRRASAKFGGCVS